MHVLIDADGCPVVRLAVDLASRAGVPVTLLCDDAHVFSISGVQVITVLRGADSVDFTLVNHAKKGDIVITQDYALAAMCLARQALCLNQNGMIYSQENIDMLLMQRHQSRKMRAAGVRMKGPAKRTRTQDEAFARTYMALLNKAKEANECI